MSEETPPKGPGQGTGSVTLPGEVGPDGKVHKPTPKPWREPEKGSKKK